MVNVIAVFAVVAVLFHNLPLQRFDVFKDKNLYWE